MNEGDLSYLTRHLSRSTAVLVTGAGFSADARDCRGRPIPSVEALRDELWQLCFGDEPVERDCALGDVYQLALTRRRGDLAAFLHERLRVDRSRLPVSYETWFSQPWERIYTLNIDDLDRAASETFRLPRPLHPISAVSDGEERPAEDALEVIHLNGLLDDDPERLTFSWPQHGDRLSSVDRRYSELVRSWSARPVVFVGTKLEEPALWQHLMMRRGRGKAHPPKSFLVVPSVSRPKQALLSDFGIQWVPMTAEEFARKVLTTRVAGA